MASNGASYDDLRALFVNCTLKRSPERSNTQGLVDVSAGIMGKQGVTVETIRAADHDIATGVWPDMTEHGAATDAWPALAVLALPCRLRPAIRRNVSPNGLPGYRSPSGGGACLSALRNSCL